MWLSSQKTAWTQILLRSVLLLLIEFCRQSASSDFGTQCIETCMREMQTVMDNAPFAKGRNFGQLSWQELFDATQNRDATASAFESICTAYKSVDECLEFCPKTSPHTAHIRNTYAGLRFICVEHRNEFFTNLPCLSQHEAIAMTECRNEINKSMMASNRFSEAVVSKQHNNMRGRFSSLCNELTHMVVCIEPITRRGCGDSAARMMLRFITLGFASFEQLYAQLGMNDHLPQACRSLISMAGNGPHMHVINEDQLVSQHEQYSDGKGRLLTDHDRDYHGLSSDSSTKTFSTPLRLLLTLFVAAVCRQSCVF